MWKKFYRAISAICIYIFLCRFSEVVKLEFISIIFEITIFCDTLFSSVYILKVITFFFILCMCGENYHIVYHITWQNIYEVVIYMLRAHPNADIGCCARMQYLHYIDNNIIDDLRGQASEMILQGTKITIQWMIHRALGSLLNHIARRHALRAITRTRDICIYIF